jgi:hypothetical protein
MNKLHFNLFINIIILLSNNLIRVKEQDFMDLIYWQLIIVIWRDLKQYVK